MAYPLEQLIARDWGDAGHADPVKFQIKCVEKVCCDQIYHGKNPCDNGKPFILTKVRDMLGHRGQSRTRRTGGYFKDFFRMEHPMVLQCILIITMNF